MTEYATVPLQQYLREIAEKLPDPEADAVRMAAQMLDDNEARDRIRVGIRGYEDQKSALFSAIQDFGGRMTQDDFDKWATDRPFGFIPFDDSFILGEPGRGEWSKWLELLQLLAVIGEIVIEGKPPRIIYSRP